MSELIYLPALFASVFTPRLDLFIWNTTPSVRPGDMFPLQGSWEPDSSPWLVWPGGDVQLLSLAPQKGALLSLMPASLPMGRFEVYLKDGLGKRSKSVFFNEATPKQLSQLTYVPGATFKISGVNLAHREQFFVEDGKKFTEGALLATPGVRWRRSATGDTTAAQLDLSADNCFHALLTGTVPALAPDDYSIEVSNGLGGFVTVPNVTVRIVAPTTDRYNLGVGWAHQLPQSVITRVLTAGTADQNHAAVLAAYDARQAGSLLEIVLPNATFDVGGSLPEVPANVAFTGSALTVLQYGLPGNQPSGYAISLGNGAESNVFNSITFRCNSPKWQRHFCHSGGAAAKRFAFKNVTWPAAGESIRFLAGLDEFAFVDSSFQWTKNVAVSSSANEGALVILNATRGFITRTKFGNNVGQIAFQTGSDLWKEYCEHELDRTTQPFEASGDPIDDRDESLNNFTRYTSLRNRHRPKLFSTSTGAPIFPKIVRNCGEGTLTEAGGGGGIGAIFHGPVAAASTTSVTFASADFSDFVPGTLVHVVSGRGRGQVRTVSAINAASRTLTVAEPFDLAPLPGDRVSVMVWSAKDWTIIGNTYQHCAGSALAVYLCAATGIYFGYCNLTDTEGPWLQPGMQRLNDGGKSIVRFFPQSNIQLDFLTLTNTLNQYGASTLNIPLWSDNNLGYPLPYTIYTSGPYPGTASFCVTHSRNRYENRADTPVYNKNGVDYQALNASSYPDGSQNRASYNRMGLVGAANVMEQQSLRPGTGQYDAPDGQQVILGATVTKCIFINSHIVLNDAAAGIGFNNNRFTQPEHLTKYRDGLSPTPTDYIEINSSNLVSS